MTRGRTTEASEWEKEDPDSNEKPIETRWVHDPNKKRSRVVAKDFAKEWYAEYFSATPDEVAF